MRRILLALAALLAAVSLAFATAWFDVGGAGTINVVQHWINGSGVAVPMGTSNPMPVNASNLSYSLAKNVNAAGFTTPVSGVAGASYIYSCVATTWGGATAQLQTLGPDGATYLNVGTALAVNGTLGVVIGANATARVSVVGTPSALACNLS